MILPIVTVISKANNKYRINHKMMVKLLLNLLTFSKVHRNYFNMQH